MTWRIRLMGSVLLLTHVAGGASSLSLPPSAQQWAAVAKLPDWSGAWLPDIPDQARQISSNPAPWTAKAAALVARQQSDMHAGRPFGVFINCLPYGMPALMMLSHNAMEFVFQPGRVLVLGESDGNRLRRIHTDGRTHPADPDPSFFGDSVGHWQGDTLVIDTIGILPEPYIPLSEAAGVPNSGDMHIVEKIHLTRPDLLAVELTIIAPHVLTRPWVTTRLFRRDRTTEITEGTCLQGKFAEARDAEGFPVFQPIQFDQYGSPIPRK